MTIWRVATRTGGRQMTSRLFDTRCRERPTTAPTLLKTMFNFVLTTLVIQFANLWALVLLQVTLFGPVSDFDRVVFYVIGAVVALSVQMYRVSTRP